MRFLSIYKTVERNTPPTLEEVANMEKLIEDSMKAGVLLATEGCLPSALGARVRRSGGKLTVTDGPFIESKELIAGFALLQANSKAEAIELAKAFLDVAGDGECEIRQIFEASDCVAGDSTERHTQLKEQFENGPDESGGVRDGLSATVPAAVGS
jgi:hypothetical protein